MLIAGVAEKNINPSFPTFMAGYPDPLDRYHTAVHDDLRAHCFYLKNGSERLVFITLDLIYYSKRRVAMLRDRLEKAFGIPGKNVMVSATHTHSGPVTASVPFRFWDDREEMYPDYLDFCEQQIFDGVHEAILGAFSASIGVGHGICGKEQNVGGNRRHKDGPADPEVWVVAIKDEAQNLRGVLINYALHPTFLHAESMVLSADYPCYIYDYFQKEDPACVVGFQSGAAGDQSSRHFRSGQTFEEAKRVGYAIAAEAQRVIQSLAFDDNPVLLAKSQDLNPSLRPIPPLDQATIDQQAAVDALAASQENQEPYPVQRTLECSLFGANRRLKLAQAGEQAQEGLATLFPFELAVFGIGQARIASVPCELFVEFALRLKEQSPARQTFLATVTNGSSSGYVYTEQALAEGGYEPMGSIYALEAGEEILQTLLSLLEDLDQ